MELRAGYSAVYYNRGNVYYLKRQYENAIADYKKAISIDRNYESAHYQLANCYKALRRYRPALQQYKISLNLIPDSVRTYNSRALAFVHLGRYQEAFADYNKAIKLKSNYMYAYYNRGKLHYLLEDYNKVILIEVIPQILFVRAKVYFEMGEYQLSIKDCDHVINDFFQYVEVYSLRADVRERLGDVDGAKSDRWRAQTLLNIDKNNK